MAHEDVERVCVTADEVAAAKLEIRILERLARPVDPRLHVIANAKPARPEPPVPSRPGTRNPEVSRARPALPSLRGRRQGGFGHLEGALQEWLGSRAGNNALRLPFKGELPPAVPTSVKGPHSSWAFFAAETGELEWLKVGTKQERDDEPES